jgi:hypothetical protein
MVFINLGILCVVCFVCWKSRKKNNQNMQKALPPRVKKPAKRMDDDYDEGDKQKAKRK